jgi:hypothetical protein
LPSDKRDIATKNRRGEKFALRGDFILLADFGENNEWYKLRLNRGLFLAKFAIKIPIEISVVGK